VDVPGHGLKPDGDEAYLRRYTPRGRPWTGLNYTRPEEITPGRVTAGWSRASATAWANHNIRGSPSLALFGPPEAPHDPGGLHHCPKLIGRIFALAPRPFSRVDVALRRHEPD